MLRAITIITLLSTLLLSGCHFGHPHGRYQKGACDAKPCGHCCCKPCCAPATGQPAQ